MENGLTFFPEYGCVLVAFSGLDAFELKTSRLHLLALDAWDFHQHDNAEFNSQNQSHFFFFFMQIYSLELQLQDS